MPLVINDLEVSSIGNIMQARFSIDFSGTYVTGGLSISPQLIGLSRIRFFDVIGNDQGLIFDYDYTNEKVKISDAGSASLVFTGDPLAGHTHGFTGDALAVHTHVFAGNLLPIHSHAPIMSLVVQNVSTIRLYLSLASIVGVFQVGEVVTGSISGDTATIVSTSILGSTRYLVVSGPSGNFSSGDTITGGTSGATGTALRTLINNWAISPTFGDDAIITACTPNTFVGLTQMASNITPAFTNTFRATGELILPAVETLRSDGFTQVSVSGAVETTSAVSGGTPSGSIDSVSAGTPSGTNASVSGGTPSGVITGSSAFAEIPNGTDISTLNQVECLVLGYG